MYILDQDYYPVLKKDFLKRRISLFRTLPRLFQRPQTNQNSELSAQKCQIFSFLLRIASSPVQFSLLFFFCPEDIKIKNFL